MRKFYVYIHTCKANGKRYVGVTGRDPESRWQEGKGYKTNKHFYSAILKYGWDNFEHEVFEVDSKEEMYYAEKYLIAYYHTTESKFGYNHSAGGEKSALGCKHSEEARKHMSESHKGKPVSAEARKHMSESHKGKSRKPFSEEHRRHMSEVQKEKWLDPEVRRKWSEACKNRPRIKIKLPDGTILEMTKQNLTRNYILKGKKFEYVS